LALAILLPDAVDVLSLLLPPELVAGIAVVLQYWSMLSAIPMYLPAVLDPLAALLLIRSYRRAANEIVHRWLCCQSSASSTTSVVIVVVASGGGNTTTQTSVAPVRR
jgi:Na+-driven multidrug efflux pump